MRKGKLKFVNQKSKFGFIRDIETSEEFYFRISDLKVAKPYSENILASVFSFELEDSNRGAKAVNITPLLTES